MTQRSFLSTSLTLILTLYLALPVALAQVQRPEKPLTSAEVVEMVKAKLSAEVIIAKIQVSRCHFDINPSVLAELKYRGVPNAVLVAMTEAPYGAPENLKSESSPQSSETKNKAEPDEHKIDVAANDNVAAASSSVPTTEIVPKVPAQSLPVSGDLAEEITFGFSQGSTLLSQYPALRGTREDQIAQSVFARLRATAAFQGVPNLPSEPLSAS